MLFEIVQSLILVATIIAIVYGPIRAVKITRKLDEERNSRDRKFNILRDLMKTRNLIMDPTHVSALNTIELEFYGNERIISSFREYIRHLNLPLPDPNQQNIFFDERRDLFLNLLKSIADALGYSFDKRELDRFGYTPQGWVSDEALQRNNAQLLSQLLSGQRPIPIAPHVPGSSNPFPPPPAPSEKSTEA